MLADFRSHWGDFEVTSYEPALLLEIQRLPPGLVVDLLFPRSQPWMGPDVVSYVAVQHGRLSAAHAVHLHPSQLSEGTIHALRRAGLEAHIWDANSPEYLELARQFNIPRVSTDRLAMAHEFRSGIKHGPV